MPDTPIATAEPLVWQHLQVDLVEDAPVDQAFIRTLIVNAEDRISRFCGEAPIDMDVVPANLTAAVLLDVAVHYFFPPQSGLA